MNYYQIKAQHGLWFFCIQDLHGLYFFAFFGEIYRNHVRLERNHVRLERKCCGQKRGQNWEVNFQFWVLATKVGIFAKIHRKFTGKRYKNVIKLFEILWKNGQKWPNGQKSGQSVQKWAGTFRWYINVLRRKWPKLKKTTNFYFKKVNIYNTLRELFTLFFSVLATRLVLYYESVTIVTKWHQTTSNVMNSQQNSIKRHQTTSNSIKRHQTTSNDIKRHQTIRSGLFY